MTDSVWTVPLSVALTYGISNLISFPTGTKTLQFPAFPDPKGLKEKSHSEILGSKPTFSSPRHIVACHVLLQRFEPSHSSSSLPYVCNWILIYIWFIIVMCDANFTLLHHTPFYPSRTTHSWKSLPFSPAEIRNIFQLRKVDPSGFEPETSCLQGKRSTAGLRAHRIKINYSNNFCYLIFTNVFFFHLTTINEVK